jgi:hypothetical protein
MAKLVRLALLGALVFMIPTVSNGRCTESNDLMCGMECGGGISGGHCALIVTPGGQTSETTACWEMSGGCMSHTDDCHCGGSGSF